MLVAQIDFQEWTPDGHLRHASFAGLRVDKAAEIITAQISYESPASFPAAASWLFTYG